MHSEKGFTLVEILVVIAIMGALTVVVGANFGKYMNKGKTEAYATELQEIQTATSAMLSESSTVQLDSSHNNEKKMNKITAEVGALVLSDYLNNLHTNTNVLSGCKYNFTVNGTVTQNLP